MSGKHQIEAEPALTVLQLDTAFPRIPGDVASPETYLNPIMITPIDDVGVADIVTKTPNTCDIAGFEHAVGNINSGIGVTSCGFLGYWQDHLNNICPRPFLTSALIDVPQWSASYQSQELAILTFDANALRSAHYKNLLAGFDGEIIGLDPNMHLRDVISNDRPDLDQDRATKEMIDLLNPHLHGGKIKTLMLECTNLPPYKSAIKSCFDIEVCDILTLIDKYKPNLVDPRFL